MITALIIVFLVGYLLIALEHTIKIDKAASALITGIVVWVLYCFAAPEIVPTLYHEQFTAFLAENPSMTLEPLSAQVTMFIEEHQIIASVGEIAEILVFLIGAMTIVELIDIHGGFNIITNRITTRNKKKLLWIMGTLTFFMSATLDNLTTAIVMTTLLSKLVANYKERWIYAGIIIIAANAGGAWSPIGDVTTIMLWVRGNITAASIMPHLILPCIVSFVVPTLIAGRWLRGDVTAAPVSRVSAHGSELTYYCTVTQKERWWILVLGVACLLFVPVFKSVTHLPPFMGILLALGLMWFYTEILYDKKAKTMSGRQRRIPMVLRRIDMSTILFFLGILLAVSALQCSGVLGHVSRWLDAEVHNVYAINLMIGGLSSVVDNVPLVAGSIATYPLPDPSTISSAADPAYAAAFLRDGVFWEFLAYCAGVGGSILIIGSAAGVVVMGLEKMSFGWYLKNISLLALLGYLAGAGVYMLQSLL